MGAHPAVASVAGKLGRAETATDPAPVEMTETTIMLKPPSQWPAGTTKESIIADLSAKLQAKYPGVDFSFSQIIEDNVEEAASGVKGANSVKLFGPDLETLEKLASQIKDQMQKVRGINFCVDFSATPYYLGRVGNESNRPFPWVVSDFGLIDAIESGLVKIPE